MASLDELRAVRVEKLNRLKEAGIDPYPAKVPRDGDIATIVASFDSNMQGVEEGGMSAASVSIAGRVMAIRGQGAIQFVVLDDGTAAFQAIFKKDVLDEAAFALFAETVDIGDFISVTGNLLVTKRGEKSVMTSSWVMASKSLLPLPEKWHGLADEDERLRKRYLDLATDPELRTLFRTKAAFWRATREFLQDAGFLEVETPTLETTTGGAEANPFKTHHDDLDLDVYLRISVGELWQKRLMAGGFPKTFEIGRAYRNEGTSPEHAQEFTNMEFYWGYADYNDGMAFVRDLYRHVATQAFGTTKFATRGHEFDLANDWKVIDYVTEIKERTGVDVLFADEAALSAKLQELGVKYDGATRERMIDSLWKYCRKQISGPAFLVGHPEIVAPLAKSVAGTGTVQRFQVLIAGSEIGNGYSELNDPIEQRARFEAQQALIDRGDKEAMMPDWEFVEMLEHGMPPVCGFGFGERLFAFLADKPLRETQTFPLVRPKAE
jgi:lysyl-tRNA synthetase class 2